MARYDHLEEARRARRGVLAGHRPGAGPEVPSSPRRVRPQSVPTAQDIERLCNRIPEYRGDGTREMLLGWLVDGTHGQLRWFLAHAK